VGEKHRPLRVAIRKGEEGMQRRTCGALGPYEAVAHLGREIGPRHPADPDAQRLAEERPIGIRELPVEQVRLAPREDVAGAVAMLLEVRPEQSLDPGQVRDGLELVEGDDRAPLR
jgi:hypothetical protein